MTVPNLNLQVYDEDLIQSIINLTKFSLTYSVYPLHDGRFLQHVALMTSGEANVEVSGNKRQAWISSTANVMYDRCQSNLGLLAELFRMVTVSAAEVAPLVRTSMKSLTVAGIPLLQGKAVDLIVSAFQNCPSARQALLEDFFAHVVNYSIPSKRPSRDFVCEERGGLKIQMFTAAILQMVQAAVSLPALDTDPSRLHQCYTPAMHWSDAFWSLCFSRLPSARAQKSDADQDFKLILEGVLQDLLSILFHSEWPAAPVLLSRFFTILNSQKGLQHADGHVRQICVDFLGLIAARLHKLQVPFQGDCEWLQQQAEGHKSTLDSVYGLLLHHLSGKAQSSTFKLARRFLICRSFAEEASSLQNKGASPEELQQLLFKFRHQEDELDSHCGEIPISSEDAQRCSRAMVQKMLGNARHTAVLWLLDMMDVKQLPTTRAKSVKALGLVVEADPAVLNSIDVQKAVEKSLQDESVSVREAALELLGCHISGNQGLAVHLFPILAKASTDSGTSVRKRAINILWESCIRSPGFPYATEACKHIMMRAGDNEKSIQDLVSKVFHNLWFMPCVETGALAPATVRSSAQRAQQLADVALAVYEAGGKAIHLPLDMNHPLVVVLQSAISYDAKGDLKKEWAAGREISQALLDEYLQAEEVAVADALNGDGPCSCPGFAYLLSLHAFAVADIYLCMPTKDPTSFVRVLAPYLKPCQGSRKLNIVEERRNAEEVLCILSVLEGIMSQMMSLDGLDVHEMVQDLLSLINTTSYILVVGAACKCLCTIAAVCKQSASELAALAAVYHNLLQKPDGSAGLVARYLFTLGHLCRYGADTIEENKPVGSDALTIQDCLSTFCSFYYCQQAELRVREAALQAVGLLTIARPSTMIKSRDAASMMQSALQADSPIGLKVRALNNLNEMLKSDEEQLLIRQQEGIDGPGRVPVKKQRRAVQSQNGQGDSLSISSGILQYHWDSVLRLATDTTAVSPNTLASNSGIIVRRQALALIETVLRGGLVAPWTAVPPLVALVTDPNDDVRLKAMKLLKQEAEKRSDFLENKLSLGVIEAFKFHSGLAQSGAVRMPKGLLPKHAAAGLKLLYKELVQPSKSLRTSFLQSLLKRFDAVSTSRNVKPDELPLLRFCAALTTELPYKRGDEPCSIVHQINAIVARRGGGVLQEFRVAMHSQEDSHQAELPSLCRSSLLLSMLLLLKEFLKKSYSINAERIASFGPSGERRKQEERTPVSLLDGFACRLDKLELDACSSQQKIRQQYTVFKHLMSHDAADYEHLARPTSKQAAVTPAGAEDAAAVTPIETGTDDGAPGWVLEAGGIANVKTGRRGGRRGGASTTGLKPPRTAKTASGVPKGGSKKKRKKMQSSEDDPDDEDYDPTGKGTKKRLDL